MRRIHAAIIALCIPMFFCGCHDSTEAPSQSEQLSTQGHISEISEPMTGVQLRVGVEDTEVDLADAVHVRAELQWPDGVTAELIVPNWEVAGWDGSRTEIGPIAFDGTQYSQMTIIEIEPFLDGVYEIPSLGIRASTPTIGRRIARLQPIEIVVTSALSENDNQTLDPLIGLALPAEQPQETDPSWLLLAGIATVIVSVCILIVTRMRGKDSETEPLMPESIIADTAASSQISADELGLYHRALIDLSAEHPALSSIAQEVERVRFSGNEIDHQRIQTSARHAIDTCGIGGTR